MTQVTPSSVTLHPFTCGVQSSTTHHLVCIFTPLLYLNQPRSDHDCTNILLFWGVGGLENFSELILKRVGGNNWQKWSHQRKSKWHKKKLSAYLWFPVVGKSYNRLHSLCLQQVGKFPVNISKTTDIHLVLSCPTGFTPGNRTHFNVSSLMLFFCLLVLPF